MHACTRVQRSWAGRAVLACVEAGAGRQAAAGWVAEDEEEESNQHKTPQNTHAHSRGCWPHGWRPRGVSRNRPLNTQIDVDAPRLNCGLNSLNSQRQLCACGRGRGDASGRRDGRSGSCVWQVQAHAEAHATERALHGTTITSMRHGPATRAAACTASAHHAACRTCVNAAGTAATATRRPAASS